MAIQVTHAWSTPALSGTSWHADTQHSEGAQKFASARHMLCMVAFFDCSGALEEQRTFYWSRMWAFSTAC